MPYWPLLRRQLPTSFWWAPAMTAAPWLSSIVLSRIVQPSAESWLTTPWSCGGVKPRMVRLAIVTFFA